MVNDQRVNMQMQVEDVKRAIAQEPDPQKKLELAQHGTAYLDGLAKQNPEAYQSVLQAKRRQGQAQQGQGGSILRPANPEDGLVDIRQSRAKSSGYLGTPAAEAQKQAWIERQRLVNPSIVSGDTPVSPQGSIVKQPYQPLDSNPQTMNVPEQSGYSQAEQDAMVSQYDARDRMQAKARQDALDLQNFRRNQGNQTPVKTPVQQQGIFDSIGSGLKSAGRGMGQYAEKLFNDPNRMAMLQGGLSMMNPNSYYDKQGFGSVFQGLETGLGQAQKGMKGVLDRRKAISDKALVDAKAKQERLGGGKEGVFPSMLTEFLNPNTAPERKKWLERRMKELAPGEGQDKVDDKSFYNAAWKDVFNEQMPKVRGTVSSLKNYINLLDKTVSSEKGILTGPGTSAKVWLGSMLTSMFGADFKGEPLENTQQYLAGMGTMVGEIIKQFGAGTGLSDADRDFAQMISGQKADEFTEDSLKQVLALNEIRMRSDIVAHNHEMEGMLKISDRKYGNLIKSLPRMSKNLREHIKMRVRTGTYGSTNDDGVFEQKKPEGWVDREKGEWDSMIRRAPKTEGGSSAFKIISVRPKQ